MGVIGVDALLHGLRPPVGALAGGLHVHQVQAVGIAEIVAVGLGLYQHPLVDIEARIVDHVVAENHLELAAAGRVSTVSGGKRG